MDLLYEGKVDSFGIRSSNSDFTPLATRLRQDGLTVYGFGRANTPEAFRSACTRFIGRQVIMARPERKPMPALAKRRRRG